MRREKFSRNPDQLIKKAWTKNCAGDTLPEIIMSLLLTIRERFIVPAVLLASPFLVFGEATVNPSGTEYSAAGALPGDQLHSSVSLDQNGGYIVWDDNASDKSGSGISCVRLNSSYNKISAFTVNKFTKGDQRKPQVQLLKNGGAIVVWQGVGLKGHDIFARILKPDGTFQTSDVRVNTYIKDEQTEPVVTALPDGGAMIAWKSIGQDGSMAGIYARKISAEGTLAQPEVLINLATAFNQRSPSLTTLANGNVAITWISEQERFQSSTAGVGSVDVYARLLTSTGAAVSDEILINSANNICANPSIAPLASGGFTIAWSEKDSQSRSNGWDILARSFSESGVAVGGDFKVNTTTFGDQFRPKICSVGNNCVAVWTSLGQDGSWEGVFGSVLPNGTAPSGLEFRANNTTASRQIFPAIGSSGTDGFLVSWSSFAGRTGFDLFARKHTVNQQP